MKISLQSRQLPEHRMHTVTLEEILSLGVREDDRRPPLEHYFSPSKRVQFEKEYIHYLNTLLLDLKHGELNLEMYLVFVLTFQFVAPLLGIPAEKEMREFYRILEQRYQIEDLDIDLHFSVDDFEEAPGQKSYLDVTGNGLDENNPDNEYGYKERLEEEISGVGETGDLVDHRDADPEDSDDYLKSRQSDHSRRISEDEALEAFRGELEATWKGRRELKESVQKRLKQDGINAIMDWQKEKELPELAEAFGRSVVIPSFFDFRDKKLLRFYRSTTEGITYEVEIPFES